MDQRVKLRADGRIEVVRGVLGLRQVQHTDCPFQHWLAQHICRRIAKRKEEASVLLRTDLIQPKLRRAAGSTLRIVHRHCVADSALQQAGGTRPHRSQHETTLSIRTSAAGTLEPICR